MNEDQLDPPAVEMKTVLLEWNERKYARVQVPKTYDPNEHAAELAIHVGSISSDAISDGDVTDVHATGIEQDSSAEILIEADPDIAYYTAQLYALPEQIADPPIHEWRTPAPRAELIAAAREHVRHTGHVLIDDASARIDNHYYVHTAQGPKHTIACLVLSLADDQDQP